jgi:hypothetical protein
VRFLKIVSVGRFRRRRSGQRESVPLQASTTVRRIKARMPAKVVPVIHVTMTTWPSNASIAPADGGELGADVVQATLMIGARGSLRLVFRRAGCAERLVELDDHRGHGRM